MELFYSRRFWSAVSYVISMVAAFYLPEFSGHEDLVAGGLTAVFSLLILGYSAEDLAYALATARSIAALTANPYDDMAAAGAIAIAESAGIDVPEK